ncbi:hypothetical protein DENSPDRAFT_845725 [Dentipellis sp. KUC8613]|nr:hypothetical protein DENSPDRAFT_845725 [Dentipellis sp. KUC8613]
MLPEPGAPFPPADFRQGSADPGQPNTQRTECPQLRRTTHPKDSRTLQMHNTGDPTNFQVAQDSISETKQPNLG